MISVNDDVANKDQATVWVSNRQNWKITHHDTNASSYKTKPKRKQNDGVSSALAYQKWYAGFFSLFFLAQILSRSGEAEKSKLLELRRCLNSCNRTLQSLLNFVMNSTYLIWSTKCTDLSLSIFFFFFSFSDEYLADLEFTFFTCIYIIWYFSAWVTYS